MYDCMMYETISFVFADYIVMFTQLALDIAPPNSEEPCLEDSKEADL